MKRVCSVCGAPAVARSLCMKHYNQAKLSGSIERHPRGRATPGARAPCSIDGCTSASHGRGLCTKHYQAAAAAGSLTGLTVCTIAGCGGRAVSKGHCSKHRQRRNKHGDPMVVLVGAKARGLGKGHVDKNGYRLLSRPGHPAAKKNGKVLEHRMLMADALGRPLLATENVHHKNGKKLDNRLTKGHEFGGCLPTCCNLELWATSQPSGQRVADLLAWAHGLIALYEPH